MHSLTLSLSLTHTHTPQGKPMEASGGVHQMEYGQLKAIDYVPGIEVYT